jgi:hypothetical protein
MQNRSILGLTGHVQECRLPLEEQVQVFGKKKKKLKLSLYRLWRPLALREVEGFTFSDISLTDGSKVVSPMRRPLFTPRKIPGTHFC